jgi:RNA polymerase sigma-70 factor (ECF subfamily)
MPARRDDTDELLRGVEAGDAAARQRLLERHRPRLLRMVALRLDDRLAARLDPSDIVQEALAVAAARLDDYARERPVPFYPWLRRLAWEHLVQAGRHHLHAARRSVLREAAGQAGLPGGSARILVDRLVDGGTSPSRRLLRQELRRRVREALDRLDPRDREVLVLRYLEQMSTSEIAATLGVGQGAVKMRHLRALQRIRAELDGDLGESSP